MIQQEIADNNHTSVMTGFPKTNHILHVFHLLNPEAPSLGLVKKFKLPGFVKVKWFTS